MLFLKCKYSFFLRFSLIFICRFTRLAALTILCLNLLPTSVDAIIYKAEIWEHPADGHIIVALSDAHIDDYRSAGLQHDILKMVASIKQSRLICEDPIYSPVYYCLSDSPPKYQNLKGLYVWARLAGMNTTNVEFRASKFFESPSEYKRRAAQTFIEISQFNGAEFEVNDEHKIDLEYQSMKCSIDFGRFLKDALFQVEDFFRIYPYLADKLSPFGELHSLLNAKILHQISESRKERELAIISAGGMHILEIGLALYKNGYYPLAATYNRVAKASILDGTMCAKNKACKGTYKTFFDPISIPEVHAFVAQRTGRSCTPSLQEQAVLTYLKLRGKIETTPLGNAYYRARPILQQMRPLTVGLFLSAGLIVACKGLTYSNLGAQYDVSLSEHFFNP